MLEFVYWFSICQAPANIIVRQILWKSLSSASNVSNIRQIPLHLTGTEGKSIYDLWVHTYHTNMHT
jgi:hypothetical protein